MKITKAQLKEIIKEELEGLTEALAGVQVFMVHYRGHNADQYIGIFSSEENAQKAIVDDIEDTQYTPEPGDPDIHQLQHEPKVEDYVITPMTLDRDLKHPRTRQSLTLDRGRKDDPHRFGG